MIVYLENTYWPNYGHLASFHDRIQSRLNPPFPANAAFSGILWVNAGLCGQGCISAVLCRQMRYSAYLCGFLVDLCGYRWGCASEGTFQRRCVCQGIF